MGTINQVTHKTRIEAILRSKIDALKLDYTGDRKLVIIAGNGLTRIAAAMTGEEEKSWKEWCRQTLKIAEAPQDLEFMESIGYSEAEIFEYSLYYARENDPGGWVKKVENIWRELWDYVIQIPPSPVHKAILSAADCVITTNFDDLFELSAREYLKKEPRVYELLAEDKKFRPDPQKNYPANGQLSIPIYKIHGSLPQRGSDKNESEAHFQKWLREGMNGRAYDTIGKGPRNTVAYRGSYEEIAFKMKPNDFSKLFTPIINEMKGGLILCLGIGMYAEELILFRIFEELRLKESYEGREGAKIAFAVTSELDPLHHYRRIGIKTIKAPLGLISNAASRAIAQIIVLQLITEKLHQKKEEHQLKGIVDTEFNSIKNIRGETFPNTYPRVIAVGQASINRVVGLETSMAQERAYGPKKATMGPDPKAKKEHLVSIESGGQSLNPALVWDALCIPCSLVSTIYADEAGRMIISRLQQTNWIDYGWLTLDPRTKPEKKQNSSQSEKPRDTENATVVAWFGLRTIIDAVRRFDYEFKFSTNTKDKKSLGDFNCFLLGAPLVYATKVSWPYIKKELKNLRKRKHLSEMPLIIYETGGRGDWQAESWAAENGGIIISSVLAALQWYAVEEPNAQEKLEEWIPEQREDWFERYRDEIEPKDDRGRICQIMELLKKIKNEPHPFFLKDKKLLLGKSRAYIMTVGELGCIYWINREEGWIGPKWSVFGRFEDKKWNFDEQDYREVRNGLECGDVARAGFVASLLASMEYVHQDSIHPEWIEWAIGWANWFGMQKIKYFKLDDYIEFLKECNKNGDFAKGLSYPNPKKVDFREPVEFGRYSAYKEKICYYYLFDGKQNLHGSASEWLEKAEVLYKDRAKWNDEIEKWRKARGIE